ncbi:MULTISPECIES: hypothetical protein [Leptolyngbya]|uniref:hypothetical protein n=1 Tax=Leptolyngbya TaxID=47251 RepID=UPI001683DBAD|nr:hypothetical protein [Leptolyngbya sp. FACHB-1624]MBD1856784.1 hypothetical protein [Leptolyngbya sp. FACHB-1624]
MNSQSNLTALAQQGDTTTAIATLINQHLHPQQIEAKTALKDRCLKIVLEGAQTPDQKTSVEFIRQEIAKLQNSEIAIVKVSGKQADEEFPDWQEEFQIVSKPSTSMFGSMFGAIASAASAVTETATQVGGSVTGAVVGTAGAIGNAATQTGQAIATGAVGAGGAIANTVMQAPASVGYLVDVVSDSPLLKEATKVLKMDLVLASISQVDVVRAEAHVAHLKEKYPNEKPYNIAHRIIVEKSIYAGGTGLASSLVPGAAAAVFVVDLAATMALQAEMVYQIACAYGMDLKASERKGEVVTIFGLALGGQHAIKAGLGLLRNVPVAGAAIGASSNAVMLYALGHAACQFYEAKISQTALPPTLEDFQSTGEAYLKGAMAQEVIMDQILVHLMVAGQPNTTWQQIFPDLKQMNFSPASLEAIAANLHSPPSLETLLDQVNQDFAVSLLAQCQKIAQLDGVVTAEEAEIIDRINEKFKAELF